MEWRARSFAAAALGVALTGCALEDVRLKPPTTRVKTPVPGGRQRQIIVVAPFADGRQITNHCGMQKSGYGNETASVFCRQSDPTPWIAAFLEVVGPPEQVATLNDPALGDPIAPVLQPR